MNIKVDEQTLDILLTSGWTTSRKVDILNYQNYFRETNQEVSPLIIEFLESFGGLKIVRPTSNPKIKRRIVFDPITASQSIGAKGINRYSTWLREKLCVVGLSDNQTLLITQTGGIYAVFDDYVFREGITLSESLQTLVSENRGVRIPKP